MHKARFQDSLGSGLVKKWGKQTTEGKHPSGVLSSLQHLKPEKDHSGRDTAFSTAAITCGQRVSKTQP